MGDNPGMDDHPIAETAETTESQPPKDTGTRYTDAEKEIAYQLWAFKLGGNCEKVSAAHA